MLLEQFLRLNTSNRTANIALINYIDGEKDISSLNNLKVGDKIESGKC